MTTEHPDRSARAALETVDVPGDRARALGSDAPADAASEARPQAPAATPEGGTPAIDAVKPARFTQESAPIAGPSAEPGRLAYGAVLGRYVVEELIGAGGMGVVYRARDPDLGRAVAIKQLGRVRSDWQWRARLLREAQAMARLAHPNVVTVYDVGLAEDGLFVAMEYVEGMTLRRWLAEPRTRQEVAAAFVAAGRGLHAAHLAGLVHRDFKPDNVLVSTDGRVRVTDFGLVRADAAPDEPASTGEPAAAVGATGTPGLTVGDAVMGTPGYMAPEQYGGAAVDARTDQFAFSCALYEALHGQRPFTGTPEAIRAAVLAGRPLEHPRDLPVWLRKILDRGLQTDPARRFPSMAALVAALEADPAVAQRRRRIAIALAAVAAAGIGGYPWFAARRAERQVLACREAPDELAGTWDPQHKAAIAAAFGVADRPARARTWATLERLVDRRAASLRAAREQSCLASARGEQSPELAAKRTACLDDRHDELVSLTGLIARGDGDPANLIAATYLVQGIDNCNDTDRLAAEPAPAGDPISGMSLRGIRAAIGRARVMGAAGQRALALEQAEGANDLARAARNPALAAEAITEVASQMIGPERRWTTAWQAMRESAAVGRGQVHARAIANIATNFAAGGEFKDAERWSALAVGLAERAGDPRDLALALTIQGHVAWAIGKPPEATAALERCAKLGAEPDVANVGVELKCRLLATQVLTQLGQRDKAIAEANLVIERTTERAAEIPVRETYELLSAVAVVLVNAHLEERALEVLKRASDIFEEAVAHRDPAVIVDTYGRPQFALERGVALLQLGRAEAAADDLAAAAPAFEGFELMRVQSKLYGAEAERRRGRAARSRTLLHEIEAAPELTPRDHMLRFTILANLELDAGDCKAAEAALAGAAKHATPDDAPDERGERLSAQARLAIAQAKPDAQQQLTAARAAFERAHNTMRIAELDALRPDLCR